MNIENFNWLYSAAAQSFAAIVAIISGFVLTKFISLSLKLKDLKLRINEINGILDNKKEHYKPLILEWREAIKIPFFTKRKEKIRGISEDFANVLKKKLDEINIISHHQKFEDKIVEFISLIYKIQNVSYLITKNSKFPNKYKGESTGIISISPYRDMTNEDLKRIKEEIEKNWDAYVKEFVRYKLEYDYKDEIASYIFNEIKNGRHFYSRENEIRENEEILNSKIKLVNEYHNIVKSGISQFSLEYYIETERILKELWEGITNLEHQKDICENEKDNRPSANQ